MFILIFERSIRGGHAYEYIEVQAKDLQEAKINAADALINFITDDDNGGSLDEDFDDTIGDIRSLRLIEGKSINHLNPEGQLFRESFERIKNQEEEHYKKVQENNDRQRYEELKKRFG